MLSLIFLIIRTHGTNGHWTSMAVLSDGSYGADKGLYFSFPVVCKNGNYDIVKDIKLDEFSKVKIIKFFQLCGSSNFLFFVFVFVYLQIHF